MRIVKRTSLPKRGKLPPADVVLLDNGDGHSFSTALITKPETPGMQIYVNVKPAENYAQAVEHFRQRGGRA